MRIHSVTLQNYRRHGQLEVTLDQHRTLISGPNEIGKSSLIEAIHRCLFYRHRSKAAGLLDRMQPRTGGDPEVTLEFSIGDTDYTLYKKFRGATGFQELVTTGLHLQCERSLRIRIWVVRGRLHQQWTLVEHGYRHGPRPRVIAGGRLARRKGRQPRIITQALRFGR